MGWKGTARTLRSTYRSIQREEQRRQRELQKQEKEIAKMEALEQAAYEVDVYENHIGLIQSVHKETGDIIDWEAISKAEEPQEPRREKIHEENLKVGFFTKLLGSEEKRGLVPYKKITMNSMKLKNNGRLSIVSGKKVNH